MKTVSKQAPLTCMKGGMKELKDQLLTPQESGSHPKSDPQEPAGLKV